MDRFISEFIFFFTVIDPIGTVPVFLAATARMSAQVRRVVAIRSIFIAAGILMASIVLGQLTLEYLGVKFAAFQVAGGIVLFLFALDMIFGQSKPENEIAEARKHLNDDLDAAVYPLAIPSIAGPGAIMAAILHTDNQKYSFFEQAITASTVLIILGLTLAAMLAAGTILRIIGRVGASIVSRIMGLLFAAIAADGVLTGIQDFFGLSTTG